MKFMRYLPTVYMMTIMALTGAGLHAQYDGHGNLRYHDSSFSQTWNNFEDLDSLFGHFFDFPEGPFEHHPFSFGPFTDFMDSLDLDFYLDSSFFRQPHGFNPFEHFSDHLFPDALIPFEEPYEFLEKHREWLERFHDEFAFPDDSLEHFHPKWQQLPQYQKKSAREIEI